MVFCDDIWESRCLSWFCNTDFSSAYSCLDFFSALISFVILPDSICWSALLFFWSKTWSATSSCFNRTWCNIDYYFLRSWPSKSCAVSAFLISFWRFILSAYSALVNSWSWLLSMMVFNYSSLLNLSMFSSIVEIYFLKCSIMSSNLLSLNSAGDMILSVFKMFSWQRRAYISSSFSDVGSYLGMSESNCLEVLTAMVLALLSVADALRFRSNLRCSSATVLLDIVPSSVIVIEIGVCWSASLSVDRWCGSRLLADIVFSSGLTSFANFSKVFYLVETGGFCAVSSVLRVSGIAAGTSNGAYVVGVWPTNGDGPKLW